MKILGMGNALVDIMTRIDSDATLSHFHLPKGSMTLVDRELSNRIQVETTNLTRTKASGGSAANTIHGLAKLGAKTAYIGKIGNDDLGKFFRDDMEGSGICTILYNSMNDTGKAMALVSPDSERTFATYLGAAVELSAADITSQVFSGYDFFYIEGYLASNADLFDKALRLAHQAKLRNCLDLASYNVVTQYRDAFRSYLKARVDIVFANEEESRALTGKDPEEAVREISEMTEIAVVKLGADGSLVRSGNNQWHIPAIKVGSLDTTGAGDLYAAGFLYGLGKGLSLEKCGKIGTLLASSVITVIGAKIPAERWEELRVEVKRIEGE